MTHPGARSTTPQACEGIDVPAGGHALADALAKAPSGARLCLQAGEHEGGISLTRSVTLIGVAGAEKTILKAPPRLAVVSVDEDGLSIRLAGLTLQDGQSDAGGGLRVQGRGKVQVSDCRFTNNRADMVGGGALYARAGLLTLERCQLDHNQARQGGAIFLDQVVHAELTRCIIADNSADFAGALRIAEGVVVAVKVTTMSGNVGRDGVGVHVSGTRSRVPTVDFQHCSIADGELSNGPEIPGVIHLQSSKVPSQWRALAGVVDQGGNSSPPSAKSL